VLVMRNSGTRLEGETGSGGGADSLQALLVEARSLQREDPAAAIERYGDVLAADPANREALTYRAWLQVQRSRESGDDASLARAVADLDEVIADHPDYPDARAFRGVTAFRYQSDAATAVQHFDVLFEQAELPAVISELVLPVDGEARAELGLPPRPQALEAVLVEARSLFLTEPVRALELYQQVLDGDPDNVEALTYSGWLRVVAGSRGQSEELVALGIERLDRALELSPAYPDALAFRGLVAAAVQQDPSAAVALFDRLRAVPELPPGILEEIAASESQARAQLGLPQIDGAAAPTTTAG
jgi:tetratricopeptide (TPR) repeat protein